jgi:GNAT superfamily N-acetyltransferase
MRAAIRKAGLSAAVTTVTGDVPPKCDPMLLPRRDCADLPPRKGPKAAAKKKPVEFRLSTPDDRDALLSFIEKSGFNPRDAKTWDGLGMCAMTAWDGATLVGAIPLEPRPVRLGPGQIVKALHQTVVAVAEGRRSAGLGSRMQDEIARFPPGGARLLSVYREEPESPAYRWYAKNGFVPAAHIDSWFRDTPAGSSAGVVFSSPPEKPDELAAAWQRWAGPASGLIDRGSRPLGAWLEIHPYRGRYEFTLAKLGQDYALLGAGTMHSETKRADILEFVASEKTAGKLLGAVLGWAAERKLAPVRWPLVLGDPFESAAQNAGFARRWGFDYMVKPLGDFVLPDGVWRYSGIDYA